MIRTKFDTLPGLVLALSVAPAEAHVRVLPATVDRGAFAKLTLRMPNESASASVTALAEPAEAGDASRAATASARTLGIAGLVAGLLGCAIAAAALVAQRRTS